MWGIIATILFSGLGIGVTYWLYIRKKRPCDILFLAIDCINVYNKLSLDFDSLEIKTNGQNIDNDLLFFSGVFVCNGHSDIKGESNIVNIELPENCKWNDIKISSISRELVAGVDIDKDNSQKALLTFGQFRMKEYITIKGLIECNNRKFLDNLYVFHHRIRFFHRIEDTENVKVGVIVDRQIKLWQHVLRQIPFLLMIVLTLVVIASGTSKQPLRYQNVDTHEMYYAQVNDKGNVVLRDRLSAMNFFGANKHEISAQKFKKKYVAAVEYEGYEVDIMFMLFLGVMDIILSGYLIWLNRNYFRDRKRMRMYVGAR